MSRSARTLEIRVWPARNRKKLAFFVAVLILVPLVFGWAFGLYWGLLAFVLLLGANLSFITPTRYVLDPEGITVHRFWGKVHYPWSRFRRVAQDKNGVFLSPFARPSRLDAFRGLYLILPDAEVREQVYRWAVQHLSPPAPPEN